jgi:hypothetical protein
MLSEHENAIDGAGGSPGGAVARPPSQRRLRLPRRARRRAAARGVFTAIAAGAKRTYAGRMRCRVEPRR